ncbi:MAG: hypothetical protein U1G07_02655 [Verrucomicrobiota bacterium]
MRRLLPRNLIAFVAGSLSGELTFKRVGREISSLAGLRCRPLMRTQIKDRIISFLLIVFFFSLIGGSAYFIFKVMTRWRVKGLG